MSERTFNRLSKKGKRRALIVEGIEGVLAMTAMIAAGYWLCLTVYALQVILGVD